MALFEVIDVSSTGDDVDDGFEKCKNNWAASESVLTGYRRQSSFKWIDGTSIQVGGGIYEVNGTLAIINTQLDTAAHGLTGTEFIYLYIDYSSIPSTGILVSTDLIWSDTAPLWSESKLGYYNSDDLCIWYGYMDTNNLVEFFQVNNKMLFADGISILSAAAIATSFTDVTALKFPNASLSRTTAPSMLFPVAIEWTYADAYNSLLYRPNGSTGSTGSLLTTLVAGATVDTIQIDILASNNGVIEMMESGASTNTCDMTQLGYYLAEGI